MTPERERELIQQAVELYGAQPQRPAPVFRPAIYRPPQRPTPPASPPPARIKRILQRPAPNVGVEYLYEYEKP